MTLPELLKKTVEMHGSDLHITISTPPQVRVHGHLQRLEGPELAPSDTKALTYTVLTDSQKKRFEESLELDFSFGIKGLARFRCNMFNQRGAVAAVYRLIPEKIRTFQELGLPPVLAALAMSREGEQQTILQVYVSSISAHEYLLGKILAGMVTGLAQCALSMALMFALFGLRLAGDPTPLIAGSVVFVFCVVTFGVLVGSAIPNQAAAVQAVSLGGFLLSFLLSGLIFPIENIPTALRWISNLVQARYFIVIVRDAFLQGGGWPAVWWAVLAIGGIGLVFYALAWRTMRRMQVRV